MYLRDLAMPILMKAYLDQRLGFVPKHFEIPHYSFIDLIAAGVCDDILIPGTPNPLTDQQSPWLYRFAKKRKQAIRYEGEPRAKKRVVWNTFGKDTTACDEAESIADREKSMHMDTTRMRQGVSRIAAPVD